MYRHFFLLTSRLEPNMFENLCTLPLSAEVFSTALHPTEPLLTVGLSSGHVQTFRLPPVASDTKPNGAAENGKGMIETVWQTRRHKGSCRTIAYNLDGSGMSMFALLAPHV